MNDKSAIINRDPSMKALNMYGMKSNIMNEILEKVRAFATSHQPVLIIGEYGTGRGWIAKKIHELSDRNEQKFSKINCYSMQDEEIRRKLFGYLSFTESSVQINRGMFERSHGGTLFFEGFEALTRKLQQEIIQSVQKRSINHLGSSLRIHTDVRLITSIYGHTCQNSGNSIHTENSIFEISPHIIFLPPLRDRRDDIPPLIQNFLHALQPIESNGFNKTITPHALYLCMQYHWPGNVRQLKNAIKLASLLSDDRSLEPQHLPESIRKSLPKGEKLKEIEQNRSFQAAEKALLQELMQLIESPDKIAESLGINVESMESKLKIHNLNKMKTES